MMLWNYISSVFIEGVLIGMVFWSITYITIASNSLWTAVRASVIAEAIGNLPYLAEIGPTEPPSILASLIAAFIFCNLILRADQLSVGHTIYGVCMTYFVLVAVVACSG